MAFADGEDLTHRMTSSAGPADRMPDVMGPLQ